MDRNRFVQRFKECLTRKLLLKRQVQLVRIGILTHLFILCFPLFIHAQFRVLQTTPDRGVADVDPSESIRIEFSEAIDLGSISFESFLVRGSRSGRIQGVYSSPNQTDVVFTPDNEYLSGEVITVTITEEISSTSGSSLESRVNYSFRVISSAQVRMSVDETIIGSRSAQSIIRSDQDPELTYEVLLGRAEDLAVDRLGIDVVQVSSYTIGIERATAIQTGWYLSPTTYFGIIHEVYETTPRTLFRLEYALKENLEIVLTQGNDRRQGIDLLWGNDY